MVWSIVHTLTEKIMSPGDPRLAHLPLIGSPLPVTLILVSYIYFVQVLGPRLMVDRKPFKLRRVMMMYNLFMVILSISQFIRGGIYGWFGAYSYTCQPIDYSNSGNGIGMAYTAYIYFLSKIVELLDTVFFVMRKKFNQITVLHVARHASIAWLMYWGVKHFPGGHGSFQGFANSFVHIFVYSYYLLSALGPRIAPFLWWKKYLTQLQMTQFVVIFLHSFQLVFRPNCDYPHWILVPYCAAAVYFLVMFINFYRRSYVKRCSERATQPSLPAPEFGEFVGKNTKSTAQMMCYQLKSAHAYDEERENSKKAL